MEIGYEAAKLAKEAYQSGKTVRQIATEQKVLPAKRLTELLDPWRMTEPGGPVGSAGGQRLIGVLRSAHARSTPALPPGLLASAKAMRNVMY